MKASAGRIEITNEKIQANDPLYAKILLVEKEGMVIAFISIDYISLGGEIGTVSDEFFQNLKKELAKQGIAKVLCGTTHTHTFEPMVTDEESILVRIVNKTISLLEQLQETSVEYSSTREGSFIINRNIPLKTGGDWTVRLAHALPPENDYDELAFAEDGVHIFQFKAKNKQSICTLFTFGCHPLLGLANNVATANFPGAAEKVIEQYTGATAMMFQATGGDVCEVDYKNYFQPKNFNEHGVKLGMSVVAALNETTLLNDELFAETISTSFPLRTDYDEEIEKVQREQLEICNSMQNSPLNFKNFLPLYLKYLISPEYPLDHKYAYLKEEEQGSSQLKDQDALNKKYIARYLENLQSMERLTRLGAELETLKWHRERVLRLGREQHAEVIGVRLGDKILLSAPIEPLTSVGKKLKSLYGDSVVLLAYSNGYLHYGATQDKYETGAYETRECDLSPEWQKAYFDAVDTIIERLRKGE